VDSGEVATLVFAPGTDGGGAIWVLDRGDFVLV